MIKYVSPANHSPLIERDHRFIDSENNQFEYFNGVPNLVFPKKLDQTDLESLRWYHDNADTYDEYLPLTFQTFGVDEDVERDKLIAKLNLQPGDVVLETGCGTGRDSIKIAEKIGPSGSLYLQDISYDILKHAIARFNHKKGVADVHFSLANGSYLPFESNVFDKVFHFGGINTFGDKKRALAEMTRVVKPEGLVVFGDENMPVWLRDTEFGKVLMNSNPHYKFDLPLEAIPIEARNVSVEWIIGGVFYVVAFTKGSGAPEANFDFKIPGARGGTHRTRYYGQLEGLTPDSLALARKARASRNVSMHDWLEEAVRTAAERDLKQP